MTIFAGITPIAKTGTSFCNYELWQNLRTVIKKLSKQYEPSTMIAMKFRSYDLAVKTDEEGNPIVLVNGITIKDHWIIKAEFDKH